MMLAGPGRRTQRNRSLGGVPPPIFSLPLADLGAGAVDTVPIISKGSPTATFTRATVAWTKLSTGLWAQVASGTARSCYLGADTTVGAYGGYFAEGAGTQLVTPTASIRDMTDVSWVNGGTMTVAKTATGIDGVTNAASTLTGGAVTATNTILQTLTAAASSRTYSAFVRRKTGTGTITLMQGTATLDITALINSSTYTRVSLNDNELNVAFGFKITTNGDAIEVDFNQFEAGAFATSPMASAGAARNADLLTFVRAGNVSLTSGTFYSEVSLEGLPSGVFAFFGGLANASHLLSLGSPGTKLTVFDGTNVDQFTITAPTLQVVSKYASSWEVAGTNVYKDGAQIAPANATFDGSMDDGVLVIGSNSVVNGPLNGMEKNVRIYSQALSVAQLQAMTT